MPDKAREVEEALRRNPHVWTFGEAAVTAAPVLCEPASRNKPPISERDLRGRIRCLSPRERWLLLFWYAEELAVADIARLLRTSRAGCYRLRHRALIRLALAGKSTTTA